MYHQSVAWGLALAMLANVNQVQGATTTPITVFPQATGKPSITSACASISSISASQVAASPSAAVTADETKVPPSLAIACLQSVPVDVENDVAFIDYVLPYFGFHSTQDYLKSPPEGYLMPGVDIIGGAQAIRQKLRNGGYTNQFEFTQEWQRLIYSVNDGHFNMAPNLNYVFKFYPYFKVVSVSEDGLQLPKIYFYGSILEGGDQSHVISINGIDIQTWITEFSTLAGQQDPDAAYNAVLNSAVFQTLGSGNLFYKNAQTLPDSFNVTFSDGRSTTWQNDAVLQISFKGINSGEALHSRVELRASTSSKTAASSTATAVKRLDERAAGISGYPSPVMINTNKYISGYFLNSTKADTCVLAVNSFAPADEDGITDGGQAELLEVQNITQAFFKTCKKAGRDKLVIDLQGNGGGIAFMGLELYRLLFPKGKAWFATRFRAHDNMHVIGEAEFGSGTEVGLGLFNGAIRADGTSFGTFNDLYGPVEVAGAWQSELSLMNYSNPYVATTTPGYGFILTGTDPTAALPDQPFDKENIVIITDGICASTCTIFVGLMTREAGVRTIALGGRPLAAPMQAMGGVKGGEVLPYVAIQMAVNDTAKSNSIPADLTSVFPSLADNPLLIAGSQRFNYLNAYPEDATDGPPLQFVYEAANCKRFYKASYITDVSAVWADAAEIAWGSGQCVTGSTGSTDGKISDDVPGYTSAVLSQHTYTGPGSVTEDSWKTLLTNTSGIDGLAGVNSTSGVNGTNSSDDKSAAGTLAAGGWLTICLGVGAFLAL
ncbi:hypothetical protein GQ53DRAFT_856196 [Thozetella sp. PMI_491]|nr:hypothetical protein GQ53DRAFT_856196 [Thozetella sp. PMI_491]